jgi:hypothetical protein
MLYSLRVALGKPLRVTPTRPPYSPRCPFERALSFRHPRRQQSAFGCCAKKAPAELWGTAGTSHRRLPVGRVPTKAMLGVER